MWFNRMDCEDKNWLVDFLLEKLHVHKEYYIYNLKHKSYSEEPNCEVEKYKLFCENEIKNCTILIDKYNADFNEFLQKRVPPPF